MGTLVVRTISGRNNTSNVVEDGMYVTGISTFTGNVTVGGTLTYDDVTNIDSVGLITARGGIQVTTNGINVAAGICTFPANSTIGGAVPASTGKAIAMAMVFG